MPSVESDVRASVDELVKTIRAIIERSVLDVVARVLQEDFVTASLARPTPARPARRAKRTAKAPARKAQAKRADASRRAAAAPRSRRPAAAEPRADMAPPAPPEPAADQTAAALLSHVTIEPGQGLEELALAMGTAAAELKAPIKKLVEEQKISERQEQGRAAYYPS